jgi:hypothetical protein
LPKPSLYGKNPFIVKGKLIKDGGYKVWGKSCDTDFQRELFGHFR